MADGADAIIFFDAARLWAGIEYHLRQPEQVHWHAFAEIDGPSMRATRDRLRAEEAFAFVARRKWRAWSDHRRLAWLLTEAKARFKLTDRRRGIGALVRDDGDGEA